MNEGNQQEKSIESKDRGKKLFTAGIVIITVSIVLGWPVLPVCAIISVKYGKQWLKIGGIVYAISWVLLGFGTLLAGPGGVKYAKTLVKKIFVKKVK